MPLTRIGMHIGKCIVACLKTQNARSFCQHRPRGSASCIAAGVVAQSRHRDTEPASWHFARCIPVMGPRGWVGSAGVSKAPPEQSGEPDRCSGLACMYLYVSSVVVPAPRGFAISPARPSNKRASTSLLALTIVCLRPPALHRRVVLIATRVRGACYLACSMYSYISPAS